MSKLIQRKLVTSEPEKQIITGLIVSDHFCKRIADVVKLGYFTTDYTRTVVKWCLDYYKKYKRCPGRDIQNIFNREKKKLNKSDQRIVSVFLGKISGEYEAGGYEKFNVDYCFDAASFYFEKRSLEILHEKMGGHLEGEEIDEARNLVEKYKPESKDVSRIYFNPFSLEEIRRFDVDDQEGTLFKFEGQLGNLIGWFKRNWLVSYRAPEKRGKTFWLEETAFQGLMSRLKVLWISLEMPEFDLKERLYKRLTGLPFEKIPFLKIPIFDCARNQDGTCDSRLRKNKITLIEPDGETPEFNEKLKYKVCTTCRGKEKSRYKTAYWFMVQKNIPKIKIKDMERKAETFKKLFGDNLRIATPPPYSLNSDGVRAIWDHLEYVEGFTADILVHDYLDIGAPESGTSKYDRRERIDSAWINYKSFAKEKHCLVVTADQAKAKAAGRKSLEDQDWSDSKTKNAHIDKEFSINQEEKEEDDGIMRIGILFDRHKKRRRKKLAEVMVLQSLELGQVMIDSEFIY